MAAIGVVYLYRFAEGEFPVRAFLASYLAHPAGIDHDLHVIFKGFPDQNSLAAARSLFAGLPINSIELEDSGYDIGSYFAAAKLVSNRRLAFFNTFTEVLADDWLKKFDTALSLPGVGLVGATGSWQSHSSGYEAGIKRAWYWLTHPLDYLEDVLSAVRRAEQLAEKHGGEHTRIYSDTNERRNIVQLVRNLYVAARLDRYILYRYEYGRYPNPHIRTNAFMIDRDRFLALKTSRFKTKSDVYRFESGRESLTKQIMAQHLKPVVVDKCGIAYDISEWKSSSTFWIGEQANLIVADNRTRDYSKGDPRRRTRLQDNAWVHPSAWEIRGRRLSTPNDGDQSSRKRPAANISAQSVRSN